MRETAPGTREFLKTVLNRIVVEKNSKAAPLHATHVQKGGTGTALPISGPGARRRWVVSDAPRPLYPQKRDLIPIVREARWVSTSVWMGPENESMWTLQNVNGNATHRTSYSVFSTGHCSYRLNHGERDNREMIHGGHWGTHRPYEIGFTRSKPAKLHPSSKWLHKLHQQW
jgi:hypothetical protein